MFYYYNVTYISERGNVIYGSILADTLDQLAKHNYIIFNIIIALKNKMTQHILYTTYVE